MLVTKQRMQNQELLVKNQDTTIKILEVQLGPLANIVYGRVQGTLPSDNEKNPRDHVKPVTLRSEKELDKVVKTSDDTSNGEEPFLQDVQVEEATHEEVPTKDVSKSKAKGVKKK